MPVKWTPETDQILLLKILETSDVSPKCAEISEKWPAGLDRPTPRAISERIIRIRQTAKASGTSSHFSVSAAKSNPSTPRKNDGTKKATPKKTQGSKAKSGKRKRSSMMSDTEASDDTEADGFKSDNNGTDADDNADEETPRKKSKKANTVPKPKSKDKGDLVKVKREEAENGSFDDDNNGGSYKNPFVEDDPMSLV